MLLLFVFWFDWKITRFKHGFWLKTFAPFSWSQLVLSVNKNLVCFFPPVAYWFSYWTNKTTTATKSFTALIKFYMRCSLGFYLEPAFIFHCLPETSLDKLVNTNWATGQQVCPPNENKCHIESLNSSSSSSSSKRWSQISASY